MVWWYRSSYISPSHVYEQNVSHYLFVSSPIPGPPGGGYPTNQMSQHRAQGLPGPYSYVNGTNNGGGGGGGPRPPMQHHGQLQPQPQQQQYRAMMQNGGGGPPMQQQPGKAGGGYPNPGYSPATVGGGGHMQHQSMPSYQQNVHNAMEAQQMRQMTAGYRPSYPPQQHQQPVQQQQPTFLTSSATVNPAALQQSQQQSNFYQQQNGFAGGDYPQQVAADSAHMYGNHMYGPS